MLYKLCILSAGVGSRLLPLTKKLNKALLPVGFKAAISRIIEKHERDVKIVIALGHNSEQVIEFLSAAHPDRNIQYVSVDKIVGSGSGPGYSLLCCKEFLQCPFILTTVDTIIEEDCPLPNENWMGVGTVINPKDYCTVEINKQNENIIKLVDKKIEGTKKAFIGLAGIKDFQIFFESLESDSIEIGGEVQVSNGFKGLINEGLKARKLTWHDIGVLDQYKDTNRLFSKNEENFDFSKNEENIYFQGSKIIKYFADENACQNRQARAENLIGLIPDLEFKGKNFFSYKKIEGEVLYNEKDPLITKRLLKWLDSNLWKRKNLTDEESNKFKEVCKRFYYDKTLIRLNDFYERFKLEDGTGLINNEIVPSAESLLEKIDFNWLSLGIPSNFHGDLQYDNILKTESGDFKLLDWRQDFGGILDYGDIYYDLSKLNGGLKISYKKIKEGKFKYEGSIDNCQITLTNNLFLDKSKEILDEFIHKKRLEIRRIEIITGLIFLNMASMHNEPFSFYVYNLGRKQLNKWIN